MHGQQNIKKTNKICCAWLQHVCQFEYDTQKRDELKKKIC